MRNIMNIAKGFVLIGLLCGFTACESMMGDFLDKAPGVDVDEDVIFSSRVQVETFLASIYQFGIHSKQPYSGQLEGDYPQGYSNPDSALESTTTDESEGCADWYEKQRWNTGIIGASATDDTRFSYRFQAIRMITVMLDRVDEVPDMTTEMKEQFKAEVRIIRALNYLEMLKRYGGMPIIRDRLDVDDNLRISRSPFEETVNFILEDCQAAIDCPSLPNGDYGGFGGNYPRGRVHKGVALSIKAVTLLYAASPLFNRETPVLDFGENNNLLCYGNYDKERWLKAAEAAKDVLVWAESAGYHLIEDQGEGMNYRYAWETYDNPEIILAEKSNTSIGRWTWPWGNYCLFAPPNKGMGGTTPTLNFVRKYEMNDGTKAEWTEVGVTGYDLQEKMAQLDKRFHQTIAYNMSQWNEDIPEMPLNQEAISTIETGASAKSGAISKCFGGFWLHKHCPYAISDRVWSYQPNSTLFQVNEFYLHYAEAAYEYYENPESAVDGFDLTIRQAINRIRARSGQPEIAEGSTGIYPDFRELIRNERAIELAFDNHRFWDIRRWMIAEQEGVMQGGMVGIRIELIDPNVPGTIDGGFKYTPYVFETRTFTPKMYFHPFPTDEVNKGYLMQNPGY